MGKNINNKNYQNITSCLLCGSIKLKKIFSVDEVCLTGYFPLKNENDPIKTPVSLVRCTSCNNIQAQELVEPKEIELTVEATQAATAKVVILETGFCQTQATDIIHEVRPDLGLFDIPHMLNNLPFTVLEDVESEKAEELRDRFEAADCVVEVTNTSES